MSGTGSLPSRNFFDELREFAVAVATAYQRFADGLTNWMTEHQEGIATFLVVMQVIATVHPEVERLWKKYAGTEWGHLLWELDFANAFALMLLLDRDHNAVVEHVLEPALTDPEFLREVERVLADAPLPEANRRQLAQGLVHVGEQDYVLAVPQLILPLEGAFWQVAQDRDLVERVKGRMRFTPESGEQGSAGAVEAVFEPLGIDPDFRTFLVRLVYGKSGNPFRHGNAQDGWRRTGLLLVVALVGWLDLYADGEEHNLLYQTFARHPEGIDRALTLLPPLEPVVQNAPEVVKPTVSALMGLYASGVLDESTAEYARPCVRGRGRRSDRGQLA
jgi:hypothetical protein